MKRKIEFIALNFNKLSTKDIQFFYKHVLEGLQGTDFSESTIQETLPTKVRTEGGNWIYLSDWINLKAGETGWQE